jgi:hypothetical protein
MAIEEDELQLAKEKAIEAHKFEEAAAILNRQDGIDDRLTELARRLIGDWIKRHVGFTVEPDRRARDDGGAGKA